MCRARCVLVVVSLYMGVAHCWDFAASSGDQLIFYTNDGTETERINFTSKTLGGLAYDAVYNTMMYVDKQNNGDTVCGYNLFSKENYCFIERSGRNILHIAYDPATENLFFTDANEKSINWISVKRGSRNNIYGNLLIKMDDRTPLDIAVDSCRGYIYWSKIGQIENVDIERARFDGSGREAIYDEYHGLDVTSLTIDTQTQKIYQFDGGYINNEDMTGRNERILYDMIQFKVKELTVSKDYIYFVATRRGESYTSIWRGPKNSTDEDELKELRKFYTDGYLGLATNYKIEDQIRGTQDCSPPSDLTPTIIKAPGNTYERCDVCVNYCLQGNCSVNDEGLPKCSCNAGYSGERCEVSACHGYCQNDGECSLNEISVPVCQCKGDYSGDRCQVAACLNYCFKGNCSLNDTGHPTCSCDFGYSGERCEVSACHGYCQNDGECSLNETSVPVCQCKGDYSGDRCQVAACLNYCFKGNCSLNDTGHPTCSCDFGYSGERCEVSACHGYCLNDGECSLNEEDEPVCQCASNYEGSRCEADVTDTTPTYELADRNLTLADLLTICQKPSSKILLLVEVP